MNEELNQLIKTLEHVQKNLFLKDENRTMQDLETVRVRLIALREELVKRTGENTYRVIT